MKGERVAVAMSGGVDSSVAASRLVEQGYEVVGLTMQIRLDGSGEEGEAGAEAADDARRVAGGLGIPHHVVDLREAFRELVVEPFCDEYVAGRTPNPCIRCNTYIKFGALLERARELGASRLATGHYARVGFDETRGRWVLQRAVDRAKDQSYTLYDLGQEQLARALFPLGEMTKVQTRARARELGLVIAEKPESQQICFISGGSYGEYVQRRRPGMTRPGPIVDRQGRVIGRHRGLAYYTIGQRHGLRLSPGKPLYVMGIDAPHNRLIAGGEEDLKARGLVLRKVNYVALPGVPEKGQRLRVKIRYGAPLAACRARREGCGVRLRFARRQRAVAPGQAAVCYEGEAVAFGGTIAAAL